MATGDVTATIIGTFDLSDNSAITGALNTQNIGGATEGASTGTIIGTYVSEGQIQFIKLERAA